MYSLIINKIWLYNWFTLYLFWCIHLIFSYWIHLWCHTDPINYLVHSSFPSWSNPFSVSIHMGIHSFIYYSYKICLDDFLKHNHLFYKGKSFVVSFSLLAMKNRWNPLEHMLSVFSRYGFYKILYHIIMELGIYLFPIHAIFPKQKHAV